MKKLLITILFLSFFSFSNTKEPIWYSIDELVENFHKLEAYDIIVLNKIPNITQQWGHVFFLDKDKMFIEFKGYDEYFVSSPIFSFLGTDRKFSILRYSNIENMIENNIDELLLKYINKEYSIFASNNKENHYTYCSKFIVDLFYEALNSNNKKHKKLFEDDFWPIYPYDFFNSEFLKNVDLKN